MQAPSSSVKTHNQSLISVFPLGLKLIGALAIATLVVAFVFSVYPQLKTFLTHP
jgi:hypothetical protein